MTSTRLPGKVLLKAGGHTMLEYHLARLEQARLPVYVATSTNSTDDPIVELAASLGVPVHRGSEGDVLSRFVGAISDFDLDTVIRVTSDCPLIDGSVVTEGIRIFADAANPDLYVSNTIERSYPRGFDFEVFSATALIEADRNASRPFEREHVTPYLYSGRYPQRSVRRHGDASSYRITLDTADDFELIRRLIEDHGAARLNAEEIIAVLDANPDLPRINAHVEQQKLGD